MDILTALRGPATIELDPETVSRSVAWFYGREGGWQPGSFVEALLTAISRADQENLFRLALAFPAYVEAMRVEATR